MPDISKIKLPGSNQSYNIVDDGARELIAALSGSTKYLGVTTTPLTDGATTNPITVGGNSVTATTGNIVIYDKAEFIYDGNKWDEFGDLSNLGHLAELDEAVIYKGAGDTVLGEATTFTASSSSVSFSGGTTDKVLGSDATFTTTVTPETAHFYVSRKTNVAVGTSGTETFVKSYPGATQKLATTTVTGTNGTDTATLVSSKVSKKLTTTSVPNVTSTGSASTWSFAMGTGNDSTTLIISGGNSVAPTLGTAITCATGGLSDTSASSNVGGEVVSSFSTSDKTLAKVASSATTVATGGLTSSGSGGSVMTGLGTPTTGSAATGVEVTQQPAFSIEEDLVDGDVELVVGITSATTTTNSKDEVTALTGIGTGTAAAQTITVGSNDKVKVAKYDDLIGGEGVVITGETPTVYSVEELDDSDITVSNPATSVVGGTTYRNTWTSELFFGSASASMGGTTVSGACVISADQHTVTVTIPNVSGNITFSYELDLN